jgi:hypothetical protein
MYVDFLSVYVCEINAIWASCLVPPFARPSMQTSYEISERPKRQCFIIVLGSKHLNINNAKKILNSQTWSKGAQGNTKFYFIL